MTEKMRLVMVTVADLRGGDLLLLPEAAANEPITVEVTTLHRSLRSRRISVWARSTHPQRTLDKPWHFGKFVPSAPIQRIEFVGKMAS